MLPVSPLAHRFVYSDARAARAHRLLAEARAPPAQTAVPASARLGDAYAGELLRNDGSAGGSHYIDRDLEQCLAHLSALPPPPSRDPGVPPAPPTGASSSRPPAHSRMQPGQASDPRSSDRQQPAPISSIARPAAGLATTQLTSIRRATESATLWQSVADEYCRLLLDPWPLCRPRIGPSRRNILNGTGLDALDPRLAAHALAALETYAWLVRPPTPQPLPQPSSQSPAPKSSLAAAVGWALAVRDDDARCNALLIRALSHDSLDAPLRALVGHVERILDVAAANASNTGFWSWLDELVQYLFCAYGRTSTAGAHSKGLAPSPPDWALAFPFPTSIAGHLDQFLAARHSRPCAAHSALAIAPITLASPGGSWPPLTALDCVRVTAQSYTVDADLNLAEPGIRAMHDLTTPAPPLSSLAQTWAMQESSWPSLPGWPCTPPFDMGADTADAAAAAVFRSCAAASALWVSKDVAAAIHIILTMPVDA